MSEFSGILPALPTPFDGKGRFDEAAFRRVIEFDIEAGAHGFWVAGGTGESVLLEDEENGEIARAAAEQAKGRAKVILHVGAPTTKRAAAMAEKAAEAGVDAICCVPPFFYRRSDEEIVEHYRIVAAAADLPLFLYNLPQATGVEVTPGLARRIQEVVPHLAGLKHSGPSFAHVADFAALGLSCLIGNHRLMLPAMTIGATGCVDGPPSIAPEVWVEIWESYRKKDLAAAEEAQRRGSELWRKLASAGGGFQAIIKAAVGVRAGVSCGDPRPPGSPLMPEQRARVREVVRAEGTAESA